MNWNIEKQLLSEVFPYDVSKIKCDHEKIWLEITKFFVSKTRGLANDLAAALNLFEYFYRYEIILEFGNDSIIAGCHDIRLFNCVVCVLGLISMYKILPETERRTLRRNWNVFFGQFEKNHQSQN